MHHFLRSLRFKANDTLLQAPILLLIAKLPHLRELFLDFVFEDTYINSRSNRLAAVQAEAAVKVPIFKQQSGERATNIMTALPDLKLLGLAFNDPKAHLYWLKYRRGKALEDGRVSGVLIYTWPHDAIEMEHMSVPLLSHILHDI